MIREILISLGTRCAPAFRQMGYRYAAVACVGRAGRCARAWAPHQGYSRDQIARTLTDVPASAEAAAIFGSGPCLDLPMDLLQQRFRRLYLVDVAHPPAARRLARRNPAIRLVERDLTGVAAALHDPRQDQPPEPHNDAFADEPGLGLVVSANLVSQLPLVPLRHLRKRWPATDTTMFARAIIQAHLDHLRRFDCPTLLIGDIERRIVAPDGRIHAVEDPLFGLSLPAGIGEWDWSVAPIGEMPGGWSIVNRVRAVRLDADRH